MAKLKLPKDLRPHGLSYRHCDLGLDLPASFMHDLWGIDENFYPVWHAYRMLWDSIINQYSGEIEDPRYEINYNYSELNFGFVLTNGKGEPTPEGVWHIWRLCRPYGWAHVINIDSKDPAYLNLLLRRVWLQANFNDRYGHKGYAEKLEEMNVAAREKTMADRDDLMREIHKTNSAMLRRVRNNFERGISAPTNPKKEIITSYTGQTNKSKIVRPITEKEGGLILPEKW